jgi:hypothetical protein
VAAAVVAGLDFSGMVAASVVARLGAACPVVARLGLPSPGARAVHRLTVIVELDELGLRGRAERQLMAERRVAGQTGHGGDAGRRDRCAAVE